MNKIIFLLAFSLIGISAFGQRQSFQGFMEAGDKAASKDDFYNAYRLFEIACEFVDDREYESRATEALYKTGTSAYRATAYNVAEKHLLMVLERTDANDYALTKYFLGQANFRQGEYDQAVAYFQQFLDEQPGAPMAYQSAARTQVNDADWAIDAMSRAEDIVLTHLPPGINTEDTDVLYVRGPGSNRYFTSNHFLWKEDSLTPHRNLSRIMKQTGENTAEPLPELINVKGKNAAHTTFNRAMSQVYYSICDFENYDELRCDLYRADVATDGTWTKPVKLDVNVAGASTTQPSVGLNADDGREYLFFASNRSGGRGGLDLYRSTIAEDGSIGTPVNLTNINTSGDDATPFWYSPRQTLYFATDGRFTFGGLDIFRAYWIDGQFRRPVNLGAPVNSSADEAYYSRFANPDEAFVSSRRPSAEALFYTGQKEVCCYEIYNFTPDPRLDLEVLTFNKLTREELEGVTVALYDMSGPEPVLVNQLTNLERNEFNFLVDPGKKYELRATKDGFTSVVDAFDLSDPELARLSFIERRLYLAPEVKLDVFTFDNLDRSPLPGATVKLFEIAEDGSKTLIEEITNASTNDFHFKLEQGKRYLVEGLRDDYNTSYSKAEEEVDLRDYDGAQGLTLTRKLYLGQQLDIFVIDGLTNEDLDNATVKLIRADGTPVGERTNPLGNEFNFIVSLDQPFVLTTSRPGYFTRTDTLFFDRQDLVDGGGRLEFEVPLYPDDIERFLPFQVYFDNDYPNPRTVRTTTDKTYPETYFPYLDRKEAFTDALTEGMTQEEAFGVRGSIDQFFGQEVTEGYRELTAFADALVNYLGEGREFTVALKGYASPRAATRYNEILSARRNDSVKNFFESYRNGILADYIKNGQLSFVETPLGESTADASKISDRLDRPADSVYSIIASIERRVELSKGVKSKKK